MNKRNTQLTCIFAAAVAACVSAASAAPTIDGVLGSGEWAAPIKSYDSYINGSDASGGLQHTDTYWDFDNDRVYGAVVGTMPLALPFANIYVYSTASASGSGAYGDGDDIIIESTNQWSFAVNGPPWAAGPTGFVQQGTSNTYVGSSVGGDVTVGWGIGSGVVEFSIDRSLLGNYPSFRYGGQFFAYEFHTGGDRVDGAIAPVPEPASLTMLLGLGATILARRSRR